jgi:plasmid segregation protein ParM
MQDIMTPVLPKSILTAAMDNGFFANKIMVKAHDKTLLASVPSLAVELNGANQYQMPAGALEKLNGIVVQVDGSPFFVGPDVESMQHSQPPQAISDAYFTSPSWMAQTLYGLWAMARHANAEGGLVIDHLTLGLPVSHLASHTALIREKALGCHTVPGLAGAQAMTVTVLNVTVLAQPQGALLHGKFSPLRTMELRKVLVIDMGGGTLDWFVCTRLKYEPKRCGSVPMGMLTLAEAVCDMHKPGLKNNSKVLRAADAALHRGDDVLQIGPHRFHMRDYYPSVDRILFSALDQMLRGIGSLDDIDCIQFTGGGAAQIARAFGKRFPDYPLEQTHQDDDPVFSNVRGFHIYAQRMRSVEPSNG